MSLPGRESWIELDRELSRRGLFRALFRGAGVVAAWEASKHRLAAKGPRAVDAANSAKAVYSAIGNLVIPVDDDPGWITFEPEISDYGLNVFIKQVFLGGNPRAFEAFLGTYNFLNEAPPQLDYGPAFLDMLPDQRAKYFTDCLTGQFEIDGIQDIVGLAAALGMITTKAVFFSNFPRHLASPGAEFQVLAPSAVRTGWDIMGFRGAVGPEEEKALRARFFEAEELPGVDRTNPYI